MCKHKTWELTSQYINITGHDAIPLGKVCYASMQHHVMVIYGRCKPDSGSRHRDAIAWHRAMQFGKTRPDFGATLYHGDMTGACIAGGISTAI